MTKSELQTIQNTEFFELKRAATEKVIAVFSSIQEQIKTSATFQGFSFPPAMDTAIGKISKGENYKGLPYLILDFPRLFSQEGVFAYRLMFHWGHGFYATLHLSGQYLETYGSELLQSDRFLNHNIWVSQSEEEWVHEVKAPYYRAFDETAELSISQPFVKIARRLELVDFEGLAAFGLESFELFFGGDGK